MPAADGVAIAGVRYAPQDRYQEIWYHSYKSGKGRRKLTFHYDPSDARWIFYNLPNTHEWIVLFRPGGDDAAVRPFDDIRQEVLDSVVGSRRPSTKERIAAIETFKHQVVDRVIEVDTNRTPAPYRPHALTGKASTDADFAASWAETTMGIDLDALDIFDINADDFGYTTDGA